MRVELGLFRLQFDRATRLAKRSLAVSRAPQRRAQHAPAEGMLRRQRHTLFECRNCLGKVLRLEYQESEVHAVVAVARLEGERFPDLGDGAFKVAALAQCLAEQPEQRPGGARRAERCVVS